MTRKNTSTRTGAKDEAPEGTRFNNLKFIAELQERYAGYNVVDIGKQVNRMNLMKVLKDLGMQLTDEPVVHVCPDLKTILISKKLINPATNLRMNALAGVVDGVVAQVLKSNDKLIETIRSTPKAAAIITKAKDIMGRDSNDFGEIVMEIAPIFMGGGLDLTFEFENEEDPDDVIVYKAAISKILPMTDMLGGMMKRIGPSILSDLGKSKPGQSHRSDPSNDAAGQTIVIG